jgi:hypothetical protein
MATRTRGSGFYHGWFLLAAVAFLGAGIILTVLAVLAFFTSILNFGLGGGLDFNFLGSSLASVIVLGGIGVALTSIGGWMIRFWLIFLIVDVATGRGNPANTAAGRGANLTGIVQVRCQGCGRLNPDHASFCLGCGQRLVGANVPAVGPPR